MTPTPFADVNALIDVLLSGIRDVLGSKLVGLYAFGSLATGAFEYETSDVDLVAALAADLDDDEFARLERLHAEVARGNPRWDDRVEVGYIAVEKLRRIAPDSEIALISPGEPFHVKQAGNDWLFNLYVLREHGLALYGPSPQTLVDPIPNDALVRAVPELMREWREWITRTDLIHRRTYQGHMIITMCRNLYLFKNGEMASKRRAASWAERELPRWSSLIRDALAWREAKGDEPVDQDATLPQTLRFMHVVIETILDEAMRGTATKSPTAG